MKFMVLIYNDSTMLDALHPAQFDATMRSCIAHADELRNEGHLLDSQMLESPSTAKSLRNRKNRMTITDGPFTEAKEVIGGYAQFELKSRQEAVESAVRFMELHKKHWPEWEGETEVRQMFEPGEFPPTA